jgi:hypothetical protein
MRIREEIDSSMRQGFLELAKAKNSEQMRILGAFQSAPKRVQATRKIAGRENNGAMFFSICILASSS